VHADAEEAVDDDEDDEPADEGGGAHLHAEVEEKGNRVNIFSSSRMRKLLTVSRAHGIQSLCRLHARIREDGSQHVDFLIALARDDDGRTLHPQQLARVATSLLKAFAKVLVHKDLRRRRGQTGINRSEKMVKVKVNTQRVRTRIGEITSAQT
jgi:hypothetical protein